MVAAKGLAVLVLAALLGCSASGADEAAQRVEPQAVLATGPDTLSDTGPDTGPDTLPEAGTANASVPAAPRDTLRYDGALTQGGFIRGTVPPGTVAAALGDAPLPLAPDGTFFAAFDRDSPAGHTLTATLADGTVIAEPLTIAPRKWQISRVNVPLRPRGSSEAWWQKRKPEWEAITAARAVETGAQGWRQDFIWPVKGRISGLFGRQRIYQGEPGSYHSGIDIAPGNGVPFVAPADGVVVLAATGFSLEGGLIIIDHGAGLNSAFLHASKIHVEQGERVSQGQQIGNVGASGRATGPHLHWSLKWNEARLDPLLFTGPMD